MIKNYNLRFFSVFILTFAMLLLASIYLTPEAVSCGDSAKDSDKTLASNSSFEEPIEPETEPIDEVSKPVDDVSEKLPPVPEGQEAPLNPQPGEELPLGDREAEGHPIGE